MDELWAKSTNIEEDETVDKVVKNRVDRILLGVKPINPNTDLRGTPTIDTTPHTEPKNIAQKIGDGISYVADGIKNTASEWADNRLRNMSMDIYSNLYDLDPDKEKRLKQAHEIGDPLGLPAQMLVDSKEAYEMAQNQYAWMRTQEIMQGKAFSANALKELYPELVDIAMDDPVSASLALKKADQILHDRGIIVGASPLSMTGEPSVLEETFKTFANAWEAGQNMDKISEIGYKAKNGEITIDEMNNRIEKINKQTKEYEGESLPGIIATETVKQISMMSTQMLRSAPVGLAAGVGLMTVVGAPLAGAALVATIFYSSLRSNAGSNYYRLVNKRNSDGSRMYTDGEAKKMADREAVMQAVVETGLMTVAYGSLGKVFGKGIAKAAIMNASTRNKLLSASRGAMRKYAAKEAAKQYVKGTAAEVAEEGWQDLISTTDEWIVGKDKTINAKAMWNSAVNAMFEALPAAIGMGLPGAVLSGGGNYMGLKNLTKEDWTIAREAYYRENEKNMTNTILKERDSNAIFKISPNVFAQKTQAQMDKAGMGTVYIDAATAAETEKGREALNRLVEEEIATQEQIDSAVKDGSQLELKSGVYMQKVNEETAGILSDYAAFDKNGKTIHEINEARQRLIKTINLVNQTKEKREQEVAETILERDFETGPEKEAMRKIFAEGMDDIKGNYKKLKEEAFKAYGDLIGYDHYAGYTPLGVDLVPVEAGAKNYRTGEIDTTGHVGDRYIRQSNNEAWYSDAWKKYGRKPNKRELYDIAEKETIKEIDSAVYTEEERKQALGTIEQARKEAETFEQLEDYINGLDAKEITERTLLSEKAYNMVYLPTIEALKNAPAKVAEAKRESAFIYARMVDNFAEMYRLPIENIVALLQVNHGKAKNYGTDKSYGQAMFDVRRAGINNLSDFYKRIKDRKEKGEAPNKIKYTDKNGVTYAEFQVTHAVNEHLLNIEELNDIEKHIGEIYDCAISDWAQGEYKGRFNGKSVIGRIDGELSSYYVCLEFTPDGQIWFKTAAKGTKEGIHKKIEERSAGRLSSSKKKMQGTTGHNLSSSISTIQKELGIVKKEEYRQKASETKLTEDEAAFSHNVDLFMDGELKGGNVKVMTTPLVMKLVGAEILPVYIHQNILAKILKHGKKVDGIHGHADEMDADTLKQLPKALTDPMAIVENKGRTVVITSLKDKNRDTIIVPFVLEKKIKEEKYYAANLIGSAYGKKSNQWILDKILGNLLYINKKRTDDWRITSGLQLPIEAAESSSPFDKFTVPNESDLVKLKNENPEYYQKKEEYAGAYDAGENAIHIFSAGNQSTVVHEAAHWWLSMLSRIAEDKEFEEMSKENPQMEAALKKAKKDRMDIRAWAMYAPEVMKEYKGTVLEKEFNAYEKEIQQNPRDKEWQERFIQERFARGFERYLMTGKVPTKELQGAFRRFKKWMISVYRTTKEIMKNPQQALGLKEPPAEIKDIFDHMLATEEEINAWSAEKRLHTIYDTGIDYTKTEKENVAGWLEDIKETIKEEALSYFMHQIKGEQMQNFETRQLPEMMETFKEQLIYNPVYRLEALRSKNLFPTKEMWNKALEAEGYTEETYIKAVKEAGGSIEEQVKNFEKTQRENFKSSLSDKDYIRRLAEEKMESEEGKAKLAEIEKEMLGKRIKKYGRVAAAALLELERIEKKDVKNTAWKVIYEIKKENGLLTKEDEVHGDKVKNEEIEELKLQIAGIQNGLNEAAASLYYTPTDLKQEARAFLYGKEIYKATNYKWWNRKAEAEGRKAAEAMKERHWSTAAYRKQRQLRFSYNALMAKEYDDHIRTVLHGNPKASTDIYDKDGLEKYGIIGLINRVSKRDSSIQMKNNARYFIHHLAFQLGLITKDGNAPLDGAGNPAPFDWKNLNAEIDVLSVMEGQSPEDIVPQWIKTIFERKDKTNIRDLPVVDFDELVEVCKEVYKMGRREYEGNTFTGENGKLLSFSDAAEIIVDKMGISFENPKLKKLGETKLKKVKDKAGNWVGELALPEIFIERMGPEIYNLIYKPMDNAFQVKRKLESEARKKFKEIMNIYPDRETWRKIRADKIYKLTEDVDGKPVIVTKEILLSIALNMGTKTNQERVSETYGMTYNAIMNALEKYMDNRDWDFVEAVWEHINSYWPQRNIVQNALYGVPLGKVPGQTIVLSNGRKIKGMYYPIKYDGELSSKTKERELNDIVRKEMLGSNTFNIGMGSTKKRAEGSGGQYIRDDLEVYIEYINESINHIAMRETTADIYKLLARKDVAEAITDKYGSEAHRRLLQWATDCWHDPVDKLGNLERYLDRMRKKFTMATMGYRVSTALLNIANIPLVIEKTGARNFIRGLSDMYMSGADKYREQRAFIFEKSSFMKERATTMDRDLARGLRIKEDRGTSKGVSKLKGGKEIIDQYGFSLIAETDFMFSLPEWIQTYNNTVFELQMKRNMTAEEIDKEAVRKADKIVRETFGSGEMKDRPAVVKSRFLSQLLPFYSYTSLVLNQFIRGGYDIVDGKGPRKLIRSFIFWYLFGPAFEGALRYLVDQATGNDKYTFLERLGYSYASNGPVSGLPVARDVVPAMYSLFMGMYSDGAVPEVSGLQIIEDIYKTGSAVKSDNKDWIDVGQAATKTTNKLTGLSDTVTDGLWAIARLTFTDTDATAFESIASILFDRKIKKKGERK
nr:MAG TPA: crystallin beta/gamma motif-containing protein [Caudoviricetes sp.]